MCHGRWICSPFAFVLSIPSSMTGGGTLDVHGWVCILLCHHCTLTAIPVLCVRDLLGASLCLRSFVFVCHFVWTWVPGSFLLPSSLSDLKRRIVSRVVRSLLVCFFFQQRGGLFLPPLPLLSFDLFLVTFFSHEYSLSFLLQRHHTPGI